MLYGILKEDPSIGGNRALSLVFATPLSILSQPEGVTVESINFKRFSMEQTVQRWAIEADMVPQDEPPEIMSARLIAGDTGEVFVQMPQPYSASQRQVTGQHKVTAAAIKRSTTLKVSGALVPNLFICIGTSPSKIYLITSFSPVNQEITIFPGLVRDVAIDEPILHSEDVVMKANFDTSVIRGMKYEDGILANMGTIKLVEVV